MGEVAERFGDGGSGGLASGVSTATAFLPPSPALPCRAGCMSTGVIQGGLPNAWVSTLLATLCSTRTRSPHPTPALPRRLRVNPARNSQLYEKQIEAMDDVTATVVPGKRIGF